MPSPMPDRKYTPSTEISDLRRNVDRLVAESTHAKRRVKEERQALQAAEEAHTATLGAQAIVQRVAQGVQQQAHKQIAGVVSRCLQAVFPGEGYEFEIAFDRKRGKTEARLSFTKGGKEENPTEASGGGAVDVAAFALRLVCLLLSRPRKRRLLVLDEPFRFVHGAGNRRRVAELLLTLSKEFQVQFILSTGLDFLRIGKVIEL